MNRVANVVLVVAGLLSVASIVMGVVVIINRESSGPDAGISTSLLTIAVTLLALGMILKRAHQKTEREGPRQHG